MSKCFALSLPALLIAGAAFAAVGDEPRAAPAGLSGPSGPAEAAAAPAPCAGCAGHDCAKCPMALAAAAAQESATAQPPVAPIRCSVD